MSIYISSSLVLNPLLADQPLTHARIGWKSIATTSNLTGTAGDTGFPLTSAINPATFERYKPVGGTSAVLNIDAGSAVDVDYLGLQHRGVSTVLFQSSDDDITYTTRANFNTGTDRSIMSLIEEVTARYWRVTLTGTDIEVIAFKVGKSLAMERAIYGGHMPITLAPVTAVRPNMSETGQWIGSSVQRKGYSTMYSWKNITAAWYRANFDEFVQNNPRVNPFFIAWRPETYPSEVAYCWATKDVKPTNMGVRDLMTMELSVEGFADVV